MNYCPTCSGPGIEIGSLGHLSWFRCRNCGGTFSAHAKPFIERTFGEKSTKRISSVKRSER